MLVIIFLVVFLFFVVKYAIRLVDFYKKISTIPSPPRHWLLGHYTILQNIEKSSECNASEAIFQFSESLSKVGEFRQKGIFTVWLGPMPAVVVTRAEPTEVLLRRPNLPKSFTYKAMDIGLGRGLINSNGDHWKSHRKLLSPAFDFNIMQDFIPIMSKNTKVMFEVIDRLIDTNGGIVTDITPLVSACTFTILCDTAIGVSCDGLSDKFKQADRALVEAANIIIDRMMKPWLLSDLLLSLTSEGKQLKRLMNDILLPYIDKLYHERKHEVLKLLNTKRNQQQNADTTTTNGDKNNDINNDDNDIPTRNSEKLSFFDILIRENVRRPNDFTEADVQSEFRTFLSAGYETTAAALAWTFFILGHYPDVQDKIFEEVSDILSDDSNRELTMNDLRSLKYTEAVVKEVHRFYAPVPMFARDADDDIEIRHSDESTSIIPKGALIVFYPSFIHRCPDHWDEPEKFKPERFLFLPENGIKRHAYAFIPFSVGNRNCLGQKFSMAEEKAIVANVCRRFKFQSLNAIESVRGTPHVSFRPTSEIKMKFWNR